MKLSLRISALVLALGVYSSVAYAEPSMVRISGTDVSINGQMLSGPTVMNAADLAGKSIAGIDVSIASVGAGPLVIADSTRINADRVTILNQTDRGIIDWGQANAPSLSGFVPNYGRGPVITSQSTPSVGEIRSFVAVPAEIDASGVYAVDKRQAIDAVSYHIAESNGVPSDVVAKNFGALSPSAMAKIDSLSYTNAVLMDLNLQ